MASPLYYARFLSKEGAKISVELSIIHPDVSDFGTDRLFAWKLLYDWVSPEGEGDDVAMASRYVKSVKLSPLKNGKVDHKADDYFTVHRTGENCPTVIYDIEVTDGALLDGIKVGDGDEVYDYVEPGRGKALTPPPKTKTAAKAPAKSSKRKEPPAPPAATYDDLRREALEGIKKCNGVWSDYLLEHGYVQRWAQRASDDEVKGWLSYLHPASTAGGAALVGLERLREKKPESARALLAFAESIYKESDDYNFDGLCGLVPLWWRLGETQKAATEFARASSSMTHGGALENQAVHTLLTMAARGAQWDEAMKLVPHALKGSTYRDDLLVPGAVAAWEGNAKLFDAILERWSAANSGSTGSPSFELSLPLFRRLIERDEPEGYLELMMRWPKLIASSQLGSYALLRTEVKSLKLAVAMCEKILTHKEVYSTVQEDVFAILQRHARPLADELLKKNLELWRSDAYSHGCLAAAGFENELRALMANEWCASYLAIARRTASRELAIEALKKGAVSRYGVNAELLVPLADLGEGAWVGAAIEKELAELSKKPTKQRDLDCRRLANVAAQVRRPDLGFAAIKLPGPAVRRYSASDMAAGASRAGDFTTALAALKLVPEGDSNGRVSAAIQNGLRAADDRFWNGPRALPLSLIDETYVKSLIAAEERIGLSWMLSAHGSAMPKPLQVEIATFLAKSPPG